MDALVQVSPQLLGLASNLSDTLMQLGSELLANSDTAYGFLKTAAKSDSNIKPSIQKIARGLKQSKLTVTELLKNRLQVFCEKNSEVRCFSNLL